MVNLELKNLLDKYMTGDSTPAERTRLAELITQPDASQAALDEFVRELMLSDTYAGADNPRVKAAILRHLDQHIHAPSLAPTPSLAPAPGPSVPLPPVKKIPLRRYAAAAAVIILLAGGAWLWRSTKHTAPPAVTQQSPVVHDIPPGQEGAILTLADGRRIVLDSPGNGAGANGDLAKQGNVTVSRLSSGQLTYRPGNAPAVTSALIYNTLTTPRGRKTSVMLADGTKVWLNAASSLRFPTEFIGKERRVEVSGEAYFEVAKNAAQPFIVKTMGAAARSPMEVLVLGTSFNITAYPDEPIVSTTLTEGAVHVTNGNAGQLLHPGQQVVADEKDGLVLHPGVDLQKIVAWKEDVFLFKGDELPVIMRQLSRWYDIEVHFDGNVSDHYTGRISRQVNISQVLKMLQAAGGVKFSVQEKEVRVLPSAM